MPDAAKSYMYLNSKSEGTRRQHMEMPLSFVRQESARMRREQAPHATSQSAVQKNISGMKSILFHPFSTLLIAWPLGILSWALGWGSLWTFWLNFFALIPLAKILGDATEELDACIHNEVVSGLLNATFGNAVEMIMTVQTLKAGLLDVVKATLLGSVLSNMLLVLGCSFFFGGIMDLNVKPEVPIDTSMNQESMVRLMDQDGGPTLVTEKQQSFTVGNALVSVTMLLVSCLSFALPTVFKQSQGFAEGDTTLVDISRTAAIILILMYAAYLVFQLYTHRKLLNSGDDEQNDDDDDDDESGLTLGASLGLLAVTTLFVSISSGFLVDVIKDVVETSGISSAFIGIILLPIVGNACEHAAAVRFAIQDKPGLSVSIAVGSSTQVALFVVPFAVLAGWAIQQPMDLDFGSLNTTVMILSVLVVLTIVVDGQSNWLEGYMLCSAYALIGVMYWHVGNPRTEL